MLFKKKEMIDVEELRKRGRIAKPGTVLPPTNKQGFIDMSKKVAGKPEMIETTNETSSSIAPSSGGFFGFMDSSSSSSSSSSFSTETNGYNKQEVDRKIETLDNKIYKLEQRVELLERKVGVNQSSSPSGLW
jgi:hypothetical protein